MNIGNIYGECVGVLTDNPAETENIYWVKPLISGTFGSPVRVLTARTLAIGEVYSITGMVESILTDSVYTPILRTSKITRIYKENGVFFTKHTDDYNRVLFATFFYMSDVKVVSKAKLGREIKLTLEVSRKLSEKDFAIDRLQALTTHNAREAASALTGGEHISIIGSLYNNPTKNAKNEIGIRIFKISPNKTEIGALLDNIKILHSLNRPQKQFELAMY